MLAFSCNSFLDIEPEHSKTSDNSVTDYASAKNVLVGMYATLNFGSGTSTADFFGGSPFLALSAQAGLTRAGGGATFYNMTYTPALGALETYWKNWHACVNAANAAIIGISALPEIIFPGSKEETPAEEKNRMVAEARCFRGWVNAHILWCFGHYDRDDEYGILCREELSSFANMYIDRKSVAESYTHILGDLDAAIAAMNDFTSPRYMSKQLAQVTKAKVLLNRGAAGDYEAALALVDDVLAKAPAAFKMEPDMKKMYTDAWDSPEVLWCRYTEDNSYRAYGEGSYSQSLIQGGYNGGTGANPSIPEGTDASLNSFWPEFATWIKADPRYDVTMGWARAISASGIQYFCPTKLARNGRVIMNDKWTTYYFRYPELYLMQAELRARTGKSIAESLAPINTMRSKRTNPVLPAHPAPATQDALMELIFREYCLEFYAENGTEWLASVRIKKNGKPFYHSMKPDLDASRTQDHQTWPLPAAETNTNKNIKPTPGYDN